MTRETSKETSRLLTKTAEISRSDQKFARPPIFQVPFATPCIGSEWGYHDDPKHFIFWVCNMKQLNSRHFNNNNKKFTITVNFIQKEHPKRLQKGQYYFVQYIKKFSAIFRRFPTFSEAFERLPKIPEDYRRFPKTTYHYRLTRR